MSKLNRKFIANNIYRLRAWLGWSQSELARKANITSAAISMLEKGDRSPTLEIAYKISNAFRITIDELINKDINHLLEYDQELLCKLKGFCSLCESDKELIIKMIDRLNQ